MSISCCTKKKEAPITSRKYVEEFPYSKYKKERGTFKDLELRIENRIIMASSPYNFHGIRFYLSDKERTVDVEWRPKYSDYSDPPYFMTIEMDPKLNELDGFIDVALRWFSIYFERTKCNCNSFCVLLTHQMTSNPDFIWSHPFFKNKRVNGIHTLSCCFNGDQTDFIFDFPEEFCNQFPKLKKMKMWSKVKITESCLLELKFPEIVFGNEFPNETILKFIKRWIDGENVQPDFKMFTFNSYKLEDSIVEDIKKNVDGAILWEDDVEMARVARKIFQKREYQDYDKEELIKLIEFNPKETFQFEQKNSRIGRKPVTATLCFHNHEGIFVVCGILDLNVSMTKNVGGRANYKEPG